LRLTR